MLCTQNQYFDIIIQLPSIKKYIYPRSQKFSYVRSNILVRINKWIYISLLKNMTIRLGLKNSTN